MIEGQQLPQLPSPQLTRAELERFLLFAVAVAGKTAMQVNKALDEFLALGVGATPFECVADMIRRGALLRNLKRSSLGQHHKLSRAYREILKAGLELTAVTPDVLERIHGIGPKTSRFFVLHSRPGERYAVLDTHILKFLKAVLVDERVPKSTPNGKRYLELEREFLRIADNFELPPAELDLRIWSSYARREKPDE